MLNLLCFICVWFSANDYVYLEEGVCIFRHWLSGYLASFSIYEIKIFFSGILSGLIGSLMRL